jgi:hypothetical protein
VKDLLRQKAELAETGQDAVDADPGLQQRIEARGARLEFEQAIGDALAGFAHGQQEAGVAATSFEILDLTDIYSRDITFDYQGTLPVEREYCQGWLLLQLPGREAYMVSTAGQLYVLDAAGHARPGRADDRLYLMLCINALKGEATGTSTREQALAQIIQAAKAGQPLYADPFATT